MIWKLEIRVALESFAYISGKRHFLSSERICLHSRANLSFNLSLSLGDRQESMCQSPCICSESPDVMISLQWYNSHLCIEVTSRSHCLAPWEIGSWGSSVIRLVCEQTQSLFSDAEVWGSSCTLVRVQVWVCVCLRER